MSFFCACFDTISLEIVGNKLYSFIASVDLNGIVFNLFSVIDVNLFLCERCILRNPTIEYRYTIQGSKFSGRFSDIYSSDMNALFESEKIIMQADCTTIAYVGPLLV